MKNNHDFARLFWRHDLFNRIPDLPVYPNQTWYLQEV